MAMKERLEGDVPQEEQSGLPIITEAQRRKEREMVTKEVCVCVYERYAGVVLMDWRREGTTESSSSP